MRALGQFYDERADLGYRWLRQGPAPIRRATARLRLLDSVIGRFTAFLTPGFEAR